MGLFKNTFGNQHGWQSEIGQGGGAIFSPKFARGEYDHRKAQRGQNAYGAGGRRVLSDVDHATELEGPAIDDCIASFKASRTTAVLSPRRTPRRRGLLTRIFVRIFGH